MNWVRCFLSMPGMLIGHRPIRAVLLLAKEGAVVTVSLSINERSHSKTQFHYRETRLTSPEFRAAVTPRLRKQNLGLKVEYQSSKKPFVSAFVTSMNATVSVKNKIAVQFQIVSRSFSRGKLFSLKYIHISSFAKRLRPTNMPLPSSKNPHFQTEARCTLPSLWKWVLFAWEWKIISISKAAHLPSFWNRGPGELGNGLLEKAQELRWTRIGTHLWWWLHGSFFLFLLHMIKTKMISSANEMISQGRSLFIWKSSKLF